MTEPTHFLNVDLELASSDAGTIDDLIHHWGEAVFVLDNSEDNGHGWSAALEVCPERDTAEATILALIALVEDLPTHLRAGWDRLSRRVFDIGVQAGEHPHRWTFALSDDTLAAVASVGARIVCTIYAPYDPELDGIDV